MKFQYDSPIESGCLGLHESPCGGLITHLIDWSGVYVIASVLSKHAPPNLGQAGTIIDNSPIGPLYPLAGETINGNVIIANNGAGLSYTFGCGQSIWNFDDYEIKTWVLSAWMIEKNIPEDSPPSDGFWIYYFFDGTVYWLNKLGIQQNIPGLCLLPQTPSSDQLPNYGPDRGCYLQINKPIKGVVSVHTVLGGGMVSGAFSVQQPQIYVPASGTLVVPCNSGQCIIFWLGIDPGDLPAGSFNPSTKGLYMV